MKLHEWGTQIGYSEPAMPTWEVQGTHRYYVQDDLLFWETCGEVTLADITITYAVLQRLNQTFGYSLTVYDASRGVSMGPAARRYSAEMNRCISLNGASAMFGAGRALRTLLTLLHNVARLFGRAIPPVYSCATEEEAITWLAAQRPQLRATARDAQ